MAGIIKSKGAKYTSTSLSTHKNRDRDAKSKKLKEQQKRKLREDLTFTSSSDKGVRKKRSKESAEQIPDTQIMK